MRMYIVIICLLFFSCDNRKNIKTVEDIEIFENTIAWELAIALEKNQYRKVNELLLADKNLVNFQDPEFGMTLLMRAVLKGNFKSVQFLLKNSANPNIQTKSGSTALFHAVSHSWKDAAANEDPKFVKILLEYGADPNLVYCATDSEEYISPIECGTSPLMHAATRGLEKVRLLIDAGSVIDYKTNTGTTAAINALLMKKVNVAHYLIVKKKAKVSEPFYFYKMTDRNIVDYENPILPISLLEDWLLKLGSIEHQMKMEIVEEFKNQGQDYWLIEKHPKTIERIRKIYPDSWEEYLQKY